MIRMVIVLGVLMLGLMGRAPIDAQSDDRPILDEDARYIEVDGLSIYLIERGPMDGLPVVLLHGFGGSVFTWRYIIDPLAQAGYRVVAFDRPPYGLSDKNPDVVWSGTAYADLTVGVLNALDIDAAVLVGHSAGGGVTAEVMALYPERVLGAVFAAGAVLTGDESVDGWMRRQEEAREGRDDGIAGLMGTLRGIDPRSPLAQAGLRAILTPQRFADVLTSAYYSPERVPADAVEGYGRPLTVPGWEAAFLSILASGGMSEPVYDAGLWARVDVPVLLMWGEDDTWVSFDIAKALLARIDGAELVSYPETGHIPMEERPEAFSADLLDWLSRYLGITG